MSDSQTSDDSGFPVTTIAIVVVLLGGGFLLVFPALTGHHGHIHTGRQACANRLRQFGAYLKLYQTGPGNGKFAPLDGGNIALNWGDFLRQVSVGGKKWKQIPDKLYVCPLVGRPSASGKKKSYVNTYWWADADNKKYFPDGRLTKKLPGDIPIAGDAPGNHRGKIDSRNVLLMDGSIHEVEPGDKLWKRAYGVNGALKSASSR